MEGQTGVAVCPYFASEEMNPALGKGVIRYCHCIGGGVCTQFGTLSLPNCSFLFPIMPCL